MVDHSATRRPRFGYSFAHLRKEDIMAPENIFSLRSRRNMEGDEERKRRTLSDRTTIYNFLAEHYTQHVEEFCSRPPRRDGPPEDKVEPLTYYGLDDLLELLNESGAGLSRKMVQTLTDLANSSRQVNQERFLRTLEEQGTRENKNYVAVLVDYCQKVLKSVSSK